MALSYINNKEIKFGSSKPLNGVYTPGSPTREYEPLDSLGIYLNSGIPLSYGVENGRYMSMSDEFAATSQGNSYSFNQFFAAQMMLGFKLHDRFIACDTEHKIIGTEPLLHKAYLAEITEKTLDYFKIKIYEEKTRTFCIRMSSSEVPTSYVDLTNSFDENGLNLTQTDRQSFLSYYRFYPLTARDPSSRAEETLGVDYYLLPSAEGLKELSGDILSKFNAFISSDGSTLTSLGNTAFAYVGDIDYVPNYRGETSEAAVSAAESAKVILGQVEEMHAGINQILPEVEENLELTKQYRDEAMSTEIGTVREDLNQLKGDLSKWIRLDGVTIKDGTDLSPLIIESGEHGYYSNNGVITPITYNDFKYFKLPIDGGNTYYLDNSFRWAFTTDTDGNVVDSDNVGSERIITSDNAVMLWVTYNKVKLPEYRKIAKGSSPTDTIFEIPSNVVLVNADTDTDTDNISNGIVSKTGTFSASGDNILLSNARSNLRKGIRLVFEATVTSGTDFEIGFSISESSANTYPHNIISVTSDNISYNKVNYPHGLSITGRLQMLFEYLSDGTADITLLSNGNVFKQNVPFSMESVAVPYVKSNGLIATDCKFTFICTDIRKKIWMFGDSYFAYSNKRWTYYLKEYGYDSNVLLDGFPGMGSVNARVSFAKLLTLGKPSYAVWFMGMNDRTDTDDTTPNADWVTERDKFITLCEANGIEAIFATIPNVPSINHKGKNKWIRESGYRYIDMCHAVGADVDVNWYGDMLSSDKIHPSERGAKALFAQVLLDLPEVMLDNL